jgi:hypothetical protein
MKIINNASFFIWLLIPNFIFFPLIGYAFDLAVEPRTQLGVMNYKFEQKPFTYNDSASTSETNHGFELVTQMAFLGVGMTVFANRFFFDMYMQKAFSASDTATNIFEGDELRENGLSALNFIVDSEFDREEHSFSLGYAFGRQWVVFGGYRKAKTSFSDLLSISPVDLLTDVGSIQITGSGKRNTAFVQDGYFIGGAYAYPVGEHAVLKFNAALAFLDGKYGSNTVIVVSLPDNPGVIDIRSKHKGDALGLSLGVTWKGRFSNHLGYSLGVNGYSYNFNANTSESNPGPDVAESVTRFSAGLSYQF